MSGTKTEHTRSNTERLLLGICTFASLLSLIAASTGCGGIDATECSDGLFCPAGSSCPESGGTRCIVAEDSCPDFDENARCGAESFCTNNVCQPAVEIRGGFQRFFAGADLSGNVTVIDRPFVDSVRLIGGTEFNLFAPSSISDLVIRLDAVGFLPLVSRPLDLTGLSNFPINDDPGRELSVLQEMSWRMAVGVISEVFDPERGLVLVQIVRKNGGGFQNASVSLTPLTSSVSPPRALYFKDGSNEPDPDKTETSAEKSSVTFPFVLPGSYEVVVTTPPGFECRGAGPDRPERITIGVYASTLTEVGHIVCDSL